MLQKDAKDFFMRKRRLQNDLTGVTNDLVDLDFPTDAATTEPSDDSSPSTLGGDTAEIRLAKKFAGFDPKKETMSFEFTNLGLVVNTANGSKKVLDGVSGEIRHSTLVAVMGPSGAGKTTFMNTLCGRAFYGEVTGSIKINGVADRILRHRASVGFVPQDDGEQRRPLL